MSSENGDRPTNEGVLITLERKESVVEKPVVVKRMLPDEAWEYTKGYTGQEGRLKGGLTLFHRETMEPQILIDLSLSPEMQEVYLAHEVAQLTSILDYTTRTGRSMDGILPMAHGIGLRAGVERARELNVLDEYLANHRDIPPWLINRL